MLGTIANFNNITVAELGKQCVNESPGKPIKYGPSTTQIAYIPPETYMLTDGQTNMKADLTFTVPSGNNASRAIVMKDISRNGMAKLIFRRVGSGPATQIIAETRNANNAIVTQLLLDNYRHLIYSCNHVKRAKVLHQLQIPKHS